MTERWSSPPRLKQENSLATTVEITVDMPTDRPDSMDNVVVRKEKKQGNSRNNGTRNVRDIHMSA